MKTEREAGDGVIDVHNWLRQVSTSYDPFNLSDRLC